MTDFTKLLFDKLSRYEILNNLLPGLVLTYTLNHIGYEIELDNWWQHILIAYVAGMVCSRVSSLLIEPICEKCKLIDKQDYEDYNNAKEKRPFVVTMQETANMHRTLAAVFLVALVAMVYSVCLSNWGWLRDCNSAVQLTALFVIFVLSYIKQYGYVVKNTKEVKQEK